MSKDQKIAIVIPAYNESAVIGAVIKGLPTAMKYRGRRYRLGVVVVDDGSRDETAQAAAEAGATVVRHILNSGTGAATATGLGYAQQNNYYIAATIDADGQHAPADLIKGLELMLSGQYDLLIGSRLIDNSGMSRVKLLGNQGLSLITRVLFGIKVTDSQSGLRIFSSQALNRLKWKTSGFEFCSEMLWRAKQQNLRIGEFPIQAIYTDYSRSKGQNNWNAFNIVKSLMRRRVMEFFSE